MDLKDIKAIIDLMKKNSISEFEMEKPDFKVRLKRGGASTTFASGEEIPAINYAPSPHLIAPASASAAIPAPVAPSGEIEIKSPMVGTFYRSPSPDSASYVEVGTEINLDTAVCIIEAMKVMNEIKAEVRGIITQVLVENAKPIEFGQPLFKVRPS